MSTPANVPNPLSSSSEHDIQSQLIVQINTMASHSARVTHLLFGVLALFVVLFGGGLYLGSHAYSAQVARAEAAEQKYMAAQKDFSAQLALHDAQRTQDAQATATLIAQIAARAKQAPAPAVQAALAPSADAVQLENALQGVLSPRYPGGLPMVVQANTLVLPVTTAQGWLSDELVLTRTQADLGDTQRLLAIANQDNALLTKDLDQEKALNIEANKVIAGYKKAAVRTRWQKIRSGVEKAGFLIVGIALGHTF